jgi:hypothetical protein
MVRQVKRAKSPKLGKQDRWPSDYGVRDRERDGSEGRAAEQDRSRGPGAKGHQGRGKGSQSRAGEGLGPIRSRAQKTLKRDHYRASRPARVGLVAVAPASLAASPFVVSAPAAIEHERHQSAAD